MNDVVIYLKGVSQCQLEPKTSGILWLGFAACEHFEANIRRGKSHQLAGDLQADGRQVLVLVAWRHISCTGRSNACWVRTLVPNSEAFGSNYYSFQLCVCIWGLPRRAHASV